MARKERGERYVDDAPTVSGGMFVDDDAPTQEMPAVPEGDAAGESADDDGGSGDNPPTIPPDTGE
jgi:hypothetical protein